jgi:MinD-like ATPase involved in chromosome partitioning or flagellar assembly
MGISIAFVSIKGGVGKTTLALETASALANDFNKKVLLVDANFSAPNIGLYLDMKKDFTLHHVLNGEEGLHAAIYEAFGMDIVPASMYFNDAVDPFKLKKVLDKHKHRYDFIIIDSSPHHSEMLPAIIAADKIFVVTTPDRVTLHTSVKAAMLAKKNKANIEGVIINKIRDSKYEIDLKEIESLMDLPVVARVKDHKKLLEAGFHKIPITVYDSLNEISREVKHLAGAIAGEKEVRSLFDRIFRKNHWGREMVNREFMRKNFYEPQIG